MLDGQNSHLKIYGQNITTSAALTLIGFQRGCAQFVGMSSEPLTRITTQSLHVEHGDEKTALTSIHSIFGITRDVMKNNGRSCMEFTKIAVVVLNQVVRPFTAKWHGLSVKGAFDDSDKCAEFRSDLRQLQSSLRIYTQMLAEMANVEDLTKLESGEA